MDWIVARIILQKRDQALGGLKRLGLRYCSPRWRWVPRKGEDLTGDLYPGYVFVFSFQWHPILECSSAIIGIVADSEEYPLTSLALDAHVEHLLAKTDRNGYLPAQHQIRRDQFGRGQSVSFTKNGFEATGKIIKMRSDQSAEIAVDRSMLKIVVDLDNVVAA